MYGQDLAAIHAAGFAEMWDDAADWLADLARMPDRKPLAADIGCGDGRMLSHLRDRGIDCWGADISPEFVALARQRALTATVASTAEVEIPSATLVLALGEVLSYRNAAGKSGLERVIGEAYRALCDGGHLVFDVIGPDIQAREGWQARNDWLVAMKASRDETTLRREIVSFRRKGDGWSRSDEVHELAIYRPTDIVSALEQAGFAALELDDVGGAPLLPGRIAFLARKTG